MNWLSRLRGVWQTLVHPARLDGALDDELEAYLEQLTDRNARAGMPPDEARRSALLAIEGIDQVKERVRDARLGAGVESVLQDFRHALRVVRRTPGFAAIAILTLGLGIGASVSVFAIVRTVLLRPLPYGDPDRLVVVWETRADGRTATFSPGRLLDLRARASSLSGVAGVSSLALNLLEQGQPERLLAASVSTDFFDVLGVRPLVGAGFDVGREQQQKVVLSHALWMRRFGGDPAVVGRRIRLDSQMYTVTAVMPESFVWRILANGAYHGPQPELWVPAPRREVPPLPGGMGGDRPTESRTVGYLKAVARMAPGRTLAQVNADLARLAGELAAQYPKTDKGKGLRAVPMMEQLVGDVRTPLLLLLCAVGLVLAVACVNVANLLLGRTLARRGEIAVRLSLGAGRARLARQFFVEALVMTGLAGAAGVMFARWGLSSLIALSPADIARLGEARIDGVAWAVAASMAVAIALALALVPIVQAGRPAALAGETSARIGRRSRGAGGAALLVGEVAMAVTLAIGAGLLLRSLLALQRVDVGIDRPDEVLSFSVVLGPERATSLAGEAAFYSEVQAKIEQLPGVRACGGALALPLAGDDNFSTVWLEGQPPPEPGREEVASFQPITPGYFRTLGLRMIAGRDILVSDAADASKVVVVNEAFARRHAGGPRLIGRGLRLSLDPKGAMLTIVGVVQDVRHSGPAEPARAEVYLPAQQAPFPIMSFVVRGQGDPRPLAPAIRAAVASIDATQPIADIRTMEDYLADGLAQPRFLAAVVGGFGGLAVLLAAIGVYGVTSWAVVQRRREIGVRIAVGATSRQVAAMVLRQGGAKVAAGVVIGTVAAAGLGRLLSSQLFGIRAADPMTYAATLAVISVVAIGALWLPAYRASRVDASTVLRD